MKLQRRALILWAAFSWCVLAACNPVAVYLDRNLSRAATVSPFETVTEMVSMRDGTKLRTMIFRVRSSGTHPVILIRIPLPAGWKYQLFSSGVGEIFAERGYHVVVQNIRGWPPSEGEFTPFRLEREDGEDTLRWLRSKEIGSGPIYSWGGSYFGITQWAIADQYSGAKVIQIASPRLDEVLFPGGVLDLGTALFWAARNQNMLPSPEEVLAATSGGPIEDSDKRLFGHSVEYFQEWIRHGIDRDYWRKILPHPTPDAVQGSVLLMAGWFDPFLTAQLADFGDLRNRSDNSSTAIIVGPWGHAATPDIGEARNYRLESIDHALDWFGGGYAAAPAVRYFVLGENRWNESPAWPPPDSRNETLNLNSVSGRHSWKSDTDHPLPRLNGVDLGDAIGFANLRDWAESDQALLVETEPMADSCEIAGEASLELRLDVSAGPIPLAVFLGEARPDGTIRGFVEGSTLLNEGQNQSIRVGFRPTAYRTKSGSRLVVALSGGNFPRVSLTPPDREAVNRVLTGRRQSSVMTEILKSAEGLGRLRVPLRKCYSGISRSTLQSPSTT